MQISSEIKQKIKDAITLSQFLGKDLQLTRVANNRYKALCPFHNEKTPSFFIDDEKQAYHCFGCSAHGDIYSFLIENKGYDFVAAVKYLADYAAIPLPENNQANNITSYDRKDYQIFAKINEFFQQNLPKFARPKQYLINRGIAQDLIAKFGIGYAPDVKTMNQFVQKQGYDIAKLIELGIYRKSANSDPYFLFYNRIIFPISNHKGEIIAFGGRIIDQGQPKYLNSPEHKYFKKHQILYNLYHAKDAIRKNNNVILCEGYMDVISLANHGFMNAVAPLGTAISAEHLQILWRYVDRPIICLDGDAAGKKAMVRAAHIALPYLRPGKSLSFAILPEKQDPDDLLNTANGKEKLQYLLENAVSLGEVMIDDVITKRAVDIPEERAAIIEELNNYADKIMDQLVRKQYLQYFNQACFALFRNKKINLKNIKNTNKITLSHCDISARELDVIMFVIFNIDSLKQDKIEEEFSLIEFSHENLIKIQTYLLSMIDDFTMDHFKKWLADNLLKEQKVILDAIANIEVIASETVGWEILYKSLLLEKMQQEFQLLCRSSDEAEYNRASEIYRDIQKLQNELQQATEA